MLLALVTDRPEAHRTLLGGLASLGHEVRVMPFESASSRGFGLLPAACLVDGISPDYRPQGVFLENVSTPVIALLTADQLTTWSVSDRWNEFVVLPTTAAEIVARVQLLALRSRQDGTEVVRSGDIVIDVGNYSVSVRGEPVELTYKEYELLKFLATHPGRVFTRESLLEHVWGYDYWGGSRTIDVHIRRIRSKLPAHAAALIETVHQVGYRFASSRG